MTRGRKPTPTNFKVLRGNPGHRPLPPNEPKPKELPPGKPAWLSAEASAIWDDIILELDRTGVVTVIDGAALGVYCNALADYAFLRGVIDAYRAKAGKLTQERVNEKGFATEVPIPEVAMAEKCVGVIGRFAVEFGLTPSARASLGNKGKSNDKLGAPFEAFLAKKNQQRQA